MAAEPAKKVEPTPIKAAKKKKGKGPLLWIVLAVVIAGGGAGGWFATRGHAAKSAEATPASKPQEPRAAAIYYRFDPAFVVNFGGEGNARYLQVMLEAMSRDPAMIDLIKNNEPAVRNDLLLLLSGQEYGVLMTPEGKERLRAATLETIRKIVATEGGDPAKVEAVYFTSFVIQ
jgi:flagellar FliL protein